MKYIVITLIIALLATGCSPKPTEQTKFGTMSRITIRTETLAPVGSEDFNNYSALFIDEVITEGGHDTHNRYIVAGIDTLDWPKELSIDNTVVLLSGLEDSVIATKETYIRKGITDFILFWKNNYEQRNFTYVLSWTEDGHVYFEKINESKQLTYKNKNSIWAIVTVGLFLYCFIAIGFSSGKLIRRYRSVGVAGFAAIVIAVFCFVMAIFLSITYRILLSFDYSDTDYKIMTTIIPVFMYAPLGLLLGFCLVFIRGAIKGTIEQLKKWF